MDLRIDIHTIDGNESLIVTVKYCVIHNLSNSYSCDSRNYDKRDTLKMISNIRCKHHMII